MIKSVHLKFGSTPGAPSLGFDLSPSVTIFVGPNNGGKSQCLRELHQFSQSGAAHTNRLIFDKLVFDDWQPAAANAVLDRSRLEPDVGENVHPNHEIFQCGRDRNQLPRARFSAALLTPNQHIDEFVSWYFRYQVLNLDGRNRLNLLNNQPRGDLKSPERPLAQLLVDDPARSLLRELVHEAFGFYFAIDASQGDQLHVRFGKTEPPDERSFHDVNLDYMRSALDINAVSDGVRAFTGILVQLYSGKPTIILADEPEAFLHPSLARKLGKQLAQGAALESKHVFVATHSAHFVMGAILSGAKVNIVRLTHSNGVGTARLLPNTDLSVLMQDPLLRSVGVLDGLFYDSVVVCEADADRAFYQEINERLLSAGDPRGISNALFLNADNKQTIPRIVAPLRKLGIPVAAITDIDVVKEGGEQWTRHLSAIGVPASEHQPYGTRRASTLNALKNADTDYKINGGVNILSGPDQEAATNLLCDLTQYGMFVVPNGEVEAWLAKLDVPRTKGMWLRTIFEKMGSDVTSSTYLKPDRGDVWDFMGSIKKWLSDLSRKGIPK